MWHGRIHFRSIFSCQSWPWLVNRVGTEAPEVSIIGQNDSILATVYTNQGETPACQTWQWLAKGWYWSPNFQHLIKIMVLWRFLPGWSKSQHFVNQSRWNLAWKSMSNVYSGESIKFYRYRWREIGIAILMGLQQLDDADDFHFLLSVYQTETAVSNNIILIHWHQRILHMAIFLHKLDIVRSYFECCTMHPIINS